MKRVLSILICAVLLSAAGIAQSTNKDSQPAADCCAQKQVSQQTEKKDCCEDMSATSKKDTQSKHASAKCSAEQTAKKDCQGCDKTVTWMTDAAECNTCTTASK